VLNAAAVRPVPIKFAVAERGRLDTPFVVLDAVNDASRPPTTVGLKVTEMEQLPPPASVWAQFAELASKSPAATPTMAKLNPAKGNPPGLETVTIWAALETPIPVPGKLSVAGLKLSEAGNNPVPMTATLTAGTPRLVVETATVPF
jgi:hypothetical protein